MSTHLVDQESDQNGRENFEAWCSGSYVTSPMRSTKSTVPKLYLVPTSIVYDQLHEVEAMTTEAYGAVKRPEDLLFWSGWRDSRAATGPAYLDFGRRCRASACRRCAPTSQAPATRSNGSRWMSEHRINRATPVTPPRW